MLCFAFFPWNWRKLNMDSSYTMMIVAVIAVTGIYYVCVRKLSPAAKQPQAGAEAHSDRQ
jgi:hypothetical protein